MSSRRGFRGALLLTAVGAVLVVVNIALKAAGVIGQPSDIGGGLVGLVAYGFLVAGLIRLAIVRKDSRRGP